MPQLFSARTFTLIMVGMLTILLGSLVGLGGFTFTYARGTSYLSDNPETCVNCHVMQEQFDAWQHSSHAMVATCNDCHTPHDFLNKWFTKAENGFSHGLAFTTGNFPETIHIRDHNEEIVQDNCVACHEAIVDQTYGGHGDRDRHCVDCHGNVGHPSRSTQ